MKTLDEILRLMLLSLTSNLPSTCKIIWANTELVLFTHFYGIGI